MNIWNMAIYQTNKSIRHKLKASIAHRQYLHRELCTPAGLNFSQRLFLPCFTIIGWFHGRTAIGSERFLPGFSYFSFRFYEPLLRLKDNFGGDWRANKRNTVICCCHDKNQEPSVRRVLTARLESECRPVESSLWLWCFEFPSARINIADSLFQSIFTILLSRLWLRGKRNDIFTPSCPLCLFWRCVYLDPLSCFKCFLAEEQKSRPATPPLRVMLLQCFVAQICCFDAGLCTLGKRASPFWIILTSEGCGEGEQSAGQSREWQHLAQRSGSSALITLLSPVLSILEMGTPPGTKYWTNYATVCARVYMCEHVCALYSVKKKGGLIYCWTCVCFIGLTLSANGLNGGLFKQPTTSCARQWHSSSFFLHNSTMASEMNATVHCFLLLFFNSNTGSLWEVLLGCQKWLVGLQLAERKIVLWMDVT